ncbi:MAG: hypothetical protein ABSA45_11665 [Verrucomicrobiota bacterium]
MRLLFLITTVLFGSLFTGESANQLVTNNPATIVDTNLVACTLSIEQSPGWSEGPSPICFVKLDNPATNSIILSLQLPPENIFTVELIDAKGEPVEKTEYGEKFGQSLTQKQLNDWIIPIRLTGHLSAAWFEVPPATLRADVAAFSLPKTFKITQAGKYTLHVRMRLIQSYFSDSSGTIVRTNIFGAQCMGGPGRTAPTVFQSVWLPEATAKVQIRPEDIPQMNLPPKVQTVSPGK